MIERLKEKYRIENKVRKVRLRKLTKRDERFIVRKFVKNPHLNAVKVSAEFNEKFSTSISPEAARQVLREARLYGILAAKKNFFSEKKQKA